MRGHSNVQGDRTVAIWEKMPDAFLDALDTEFGIRSPRRHGLDAVDSIRGIRDGRAALVLPSLDRTDRDVRKGQRQLVPVEHSMSVVHLA